jgi:hypothetical protein
MRRRPWLALGALVLATASLARMGAATSRGGDAENGGAEDGKESAAPFALVELFTSEGCSSCPPADVLLGEIVQDARKHGRRVFGLAFHVDYWNGPGWTDPYSDRAFSLRQQAYARAFKQKGIYTPQMVVNGGEEFVGADRPRSRAAIGAALKRPARALVQLQPQKPKAPGSLAVTFAVGQAPREAVLNLAVVERGLRSVVKGGENRGHTLRHENVVRAFTAVRLDEGGKGSVELKLPVDLARKNASVIAYVQEAGTRGVLGATELALAADASR